MCSGGVLGYSMLYPYSDNYLDDETVPSSEKLVFQVSLLLDDVFILFLI